MDRLELWRKHGGKYTDEELIGSLRRVGRDLGRAPTAEEWRNLSEVLPDVETYCRRFGKWVLALREAGLESRYNARDEVLLDKLNDFLDRTGDYPTKAQCTPKNGVPSASTLRNRFGSFSAAITKAAARRSQSADAGDVHLDHF